MFDIGTPVRNQAAPQGLWPRFRTAVFGPQQHRLTERLQSAHWLSYLLVMTQSVAVVLVIGHSLLALMLQGDWFIRGIAAAGLFVLVSSVYAADMALLATMKRVPALVRNRASWALYEAIAYVFFVLVIEASTFGIVAAILDTNPRALLAPAPIIPVHGLLFTVQIVMRAVLLAWTILQLFIVSGTLPPQLTTIMATGREIVGAFLETQLAQLDMSGTPLAASFDVYASMSEPPQRLKTWWNGWLVRRDAHRAAEEARQATAVQNALSAIDTARTSTAPTEPTQPTPPEPDRTGRRRIPNSPTIRLVAPSEMKQARAYAGRSHKQGTALHDARLATAVELMRANPQLTVRELASHFGLRSNSSVHGIYREARHSLGEMGGVGRSEAVI